MHRNQTHEVSENTNTKMYSDDINTATVGPIIDGFFDKMNMSQVRSMLVGRPDDCTVQLMSHMAAQMVQLCADSARAVLLQNSIPQERCIHSLFRELEGHIGSIAFSLTSESDHGAREGFIKELIQVLLGRFAHCTCTQSGSQQENQQVSQTEQPEKDLESSLSVEPTQMANAEASEVEPEPEKAAVASEEQKPSASPQGEAEGKGLVSTLLQAVLSQAAKKSKACPSDSLHQRLLDQICSEIKTADLTLSPKAVQDLAKVIFKDFCKETLSKPNNILTLLKLGEPTVEKLFISVFKKHFVASTQKLELESSEIKAQKQLSVEVCVEELAMRAFKKARVPYTDDTVYEIKKRLFEKIWADVQDIDFQPSSKSFKTLHKNPECVMILFNLDQEVGEKKIIKTFKEHLMSAAAPAGRIRRFFSFLGRRLGITRRQSRLSPL
ncbi:NLR family CARD domain-containing protein 3 [Sarotherodon galilaeus]